MADVDRDLALALALTAGGTFLLADLDVLLPAPAEESAFFGLGFGAGFARALLEAVTVVALGLEPDFFFDGALLLSFSESFSLLLLVASFGAGGGMEPRSGVGSTPLVCRADGGLVGGDAGRDPDSLALRDDGLASKVAI